VAAHFNQGRDIIITSILEVDDDEEVVYLDYGPNEELNRRLVEAEKILFVTAQDKVKVQFSAAGARKTSWEGRPAFSIALPEKMYKFQRREFYRVTTPIVNPVKCILSQENGGRVEAPLADISIGGVGLIAPAGFNAETGTEYRDCRISLPEVGVIVSSLEVRNSREVTLKSGAKSLRVGCRFVNLPPSMQVLIQRYIIKLDRERRAMAAE
jgi:c-di-GMP-binding flagellar brake protein YcgR